MTELRHVVICFLANKNIQWEKKRKCWKIGELDI